MYCAALLHAAEPSDLEARVHAQRIRAAAAEGEPIERTELFGICRELEGVRWCEGYIAALLVSLEIPRTPACLPMSDMAPFQYGNIWEHTQSWLYSHPEILDISVYKAITSALKAQDGCEF